MTDETRNDMCPECPHCGYEHEHDGGHFYDEASSGGEHECESCLKTFIWTIHRLEWWETKPVARRQSGK